MRRRPDGCWRLRLHSRRRATLKQGEGVGQRPPAAVHVGGVRHMDRPAPPLVDPILSLSDAEERIRKLDHSRDWLEVGQVLHEVDSRRLYSPKFPSVDSWIKSGELSRPRSPGSPPWLRSSQGKRMLYGYRKLCVEMRL